MAPLIRERFARRFFSKAHLVIDLATLEVLVKAGFLDDLIAMLKAGFLTGNYSPQIPGLHTENKGGLREHFFTVIKVNGDQQKPNMRNPELLELHLKRICESKDAAKRYYRRLADLISFEDVGDNGVPQLARSDLSDPHIVKEIAKLALRANGIPEDEIKFSTIEVLPLDGFKFAIATDINFERLSRFVPEGNRATFTQNLLFTALGDARWDIGTAASVPNLNFAILQIHAAVSGLSGHGADHGGATIGGFGAQ